MFADFTSATSSEKIASGFNLDSFDDIQLPNNLKVLLNDFYHFCACPSAFINVKNDCIYSEAWNFEKKPTYELFKNKSKIDLDVAQVEAKKEDDSVEIQYCKGLRSVWIPVKIGDLVFGYFVHGQFLRESDPLSIKASHGSKITKKEKQILEFVKILTDEQVEENIYTAKRFSDAIEHQLKMSFELNLEIKKNKNAANQLKIQKTFFENLFHNSPDAIAILDNEDCVIQINHKFERLFEYSQDEVKSKKINDLIVPENYKKEGVGATKEVTEGEDVDLTTIRQTKSGKQIHVQILGKPIVLGKDQIAVYAIYRNLTQQIWNQKSHQIIYGISEILNSALNTIEIIKKIEKELEQIIGAGKLFVELITPNGRSLRILNKEINDFEKINFSQSLSSVVIREKRMIYIDEDQIENTVETHRLSLAKQPKTWLGIPLITDGEILGVFGVSSFNTSTSLNLDSIKLLEVVSAQLASGLTKKLKDLELRMLYRSVEQSPASVIITDIKGNIEYVNPKFSSISGYTVEEIIGKNPRVLKSGFTPDETYKDMWRAISTGKEWSGEFLNVKKNKDLYWERASLSAIKDESGKITHFVAVKEDISGYKKFEKELLEAKNRAEESDQLKSAFLANMSHELRTPLNAVIGFSNLCDESLSTPEILEFVRMINKSGNQLLGIIEDILNFTSIEHGNVEISEEEFLMENFNKDVQKYALEKQIQENKERLQLLFKEDESFSDILVKTDYQKLLHVVLNLIKNALKFTTEGFVEFGYRQENGKLILYVKDSGVGIEKSKKDVIFESFRQADDSINRTFGGTGLGLAIVKKIMDALGGTVEVESEINEGSTFTLQLDCILSSKLIRNLKETEQKMKAKVPLILVVEDELSNYKLIKAILEMNSYNVIRAKSGMEAIEECRNNENIRLVLMDIRMPGMDGLTATKEIKKIRSQLPVIAQTAYAMNLDRDRALNSGCDDYISKPLKRDVLLSKLKMHLELSQK